MNLESILDWGHSCSSIVISLALMVVGAVVVRPARPVAGWLLVAAGGVDMLSTCCFRGIDSYRQQASGDPMVLELTSRALGITELVLYLGLLIGAAAMLTSAKPAEEYRPPV